MNAEPERSAEVTGEDDTTTKPSHGSGGDAPDAAQSFHLIGNMDAMEWAREFVRLFGGDEGLMLGWFANAIMAGHDHAMRQAESSRPQRAEVERLLNWHLDCLDEGSSPRFTSRKAVLDYCCGPEEA